MSTARETSLSSPAWGARGDRARALPSRAALRPARAPGSVPAFETRRSSEAAGAALLVLGWILLWAYFVVGVAEQAAALRSTVERGGAGAVTADATAGTPRPPVTARARP